MNFAQLNAVLDATHLSPEQLAPKFGVGSMTVRRWQKEERGKKVPRGHQWSIIESVYQLVLEGTLSAESEEVRSLLKDSTSLSFQATIQGMGVSSATFTSGDSQQDKIMLMLSQIGLNEKHSQEVEGSEKKLSYFKKMGSEWQKRISTLVDVVQSKKLSRADKLIAYGALFYLVCPFDLIPDHIPVIGLLDDFGVLGFAVAYYANKYSGKL